jgi:hypothetical protein
MSNDLQQFRPAYLKLQEDMERLSRTINTSYLNFYEQMEGVLEPIRRHHRELTRSIELPTLAFSPLRELIQANQRWQDLIDQSTATIRIFEDCKQIHRTWLDPLKPMQGRIAEIQAAAKLSLTDVTYHLTATESLFARVDLVALRRAVGLPETTCLKIESVIGDVMLPYKKLADTIRTLADVTHLPAFVLPGAARELFTTGYALEAIYLPNRSDNEREQFEGQLIADAKQEASDCLALLQAVDPDLAQPYMGAYDAMRDRNADRTRHILSSLRELWNHLLRCLAPDEHVRAWVPKDGKELLHKGSPTRKARILYVCRHLNHEPLTDFIDQDTRALLEMVELFNRVHQLRLDLTDEQLRALLLRTDSWLTYILRIWQTSK